jgi:hypothetical protein
MIPDLYFLNESDMFVVVVVAAAVWSVFRMWLIVSYFVLILFVHPNRKKSQDVDLGLAIDQLGNTWCSHFCVSLAK